MSKVVPLPLPLKPDPEQAMKHLSLLEPASSLGLITDFLFLLIPEKNSNDKNFKPVVIYGPLVNVWPEISSLNSKGYGVFVGVNETRGPSRKRKDIVRIRAVWRELDTVNPPPTPCSPTFTVNTSENKFHEYYCVDDELDHSVSEGVLQCLVDDYDCDPSAKDISRVLRLTGTFNHKYKNPFLVRITENSGQYYPAQKIIQYFPPTERRKRQPLPKLLAEIKNSNSIALKMADIICALLTIDPRSRENCPYDLWLKIGMAFIVLQKVAMMGFIYLIGGARLISSDTMPKQ